MSEDKKVLSDEELEDVSGGSVNRGSKNPICIGSIDCTDGNCMELVKANRLRVGVEPPYTSCNKKGTKEVCTGCKYNV